MYRTFNPNPCGKKTGDCVVRAIALLLNRSWNEVYLGICFYGFKLCDMPNSNSVWNKYLLDNGYTQKTANFSSVEEFCREHPKGRYLLATGTHAVTVIDGDYYDAWNSGNEIIVYYYAKEEE